MNQKTFTFSPALGGGSITMRELTTGEVEDVLADEARAAKASKSEPSALKMQGALARESISALNGKPFPRGMAGEIEWRKLSEKKRSLLFQGYQSLNQTTDEEDADFLSSAEATEQSD